MALVALKGGFETAVKRWASLTDEQIMQAALDAVYEVSEDLLGVIEERAGWTPNDRWVHVSRYFTVKPGGGVWINPTEPESREAYELEYGSIDRAPVPVLRNAVSRTFEQHSRQWSASFERRVFGA